MSRSLLSSAIVFLILSQMTVSGVAHRRCGGFFTFDHHDMNITLNSPDYPNMYPKQVQCQWTIVSATNTRLRLEFLDFAIEGSSRCLYDKLLVDGSSCDFHTPSLLCGRTKPQTIESTGRILCLRFFSDSAVNLRGFHAKITSTDDSLGITSAREENSVNQADTDKSESSCSFFPLIITRDVTIKSPNFGSGQQYPPSIVCRWLIYVEMFQIAILRFTTVDTDNHSDCEFDYVLIFKGDEAKPNIHRKICGPKLPNPITITEPIMISFKFDGLGKGKGFSADIEFEARNNAQRDTNSQLLNTSSIDRNLPNSPTNFHLTPALLQPHLGLQQPPQMDANEMPNTKGINTLPLPTTGETKSVLTKQGMENLGLNQLIKTTSNQIKSTSVETEFSKVSPFPGIDFLFSLQPTPTFVSSPSSSYYSFISSTNYQKTHSDSQFSDFKHIIRSSEMVSVGNVLWMNEPTYGNLGSTHTARIRKRENAQTSLQLTMTTMPAETMAMGTPSLPGSTKLSSSVESSGLPEKTGISSTSAGNIVTTATSTSQESIKADGVSSPISSLSSSLVTACSGLISTQNDKSGLVVSPGFLEHQPYPDNVTCTWRIDGGKDKNITIQFLNFSLTLQTTCSDDFLEIFNIISDSYKLVGRYCGLLLPGNITSSGEALVIKFHSNQYESFKGFQLVYRLYETTISQPQCGLSNVPLPQTSVSGSTSSVAGQWPWMVALFYGSDFQCGATLMSKQWMVTAAHCFYNLVNFPHLITARIGVVDIQSPGNIIKHITEVILHPQNNYVYENDIALIKLDSPVSVTPSQSLVCLDVTPRDWGNGTSCFVSGWGVTNRTRK